ncbi:hypothetical protein [Curtobacterium sp. MCSS17_016]|uniref:hypothetical protein n=1 Tax=Curtobacterium sp. MCSS17_016 TaxID=2175644 RepID=UPI000DA99C8E|nr:hypothetical protein [Curtobacterium sp. MCSS17_016]WIE80954.1 hypothetical protein DEJ19_020775 [Curtobacterium sp. MCSS17_016]
MSTFTTGEARQRELFPIRHRVGLSEPTMPGWSDLVAAIRQVNLEHDNAGRENPILVVFRTYTSPGEPDLGVIAARFVAALNGGFATYAGPALIDDLNLTLRDVRRNLRFRGHPDADSVITAYRSHATAVLTRLAAAAAATAAA